MNLSEVNWDFNVAGTWPLPIKAAAIVLLCIIVAGIGGYYDTSDQWDELKRTEAKEKELLTTFGFKHKKAVNLEAYQDQLTKIEASLGEMIKQMPTQAEVASLLVDISQTGLASGLEFRLFKPGSVIRKEFYSELPINIKVIGKYEELGLFVSGLASLPRIVTVHDVKIVPLKANDSDVMSMDAIIKTYNEGTEGGSVEQKKKKRNRGR